MSSIGTVPPWEFTQEGSFPAPFTVPIPASLEVQPYTATATFDGTGAGGNFVPTITIIGPGGEKLARVQPQSIVTAGNTASCTWLPPFGAAASSPATGTGGIEFGGAAPTYGPVNTGEWLEVNTTAHGGSQNVGLFINDEEAADGGIIIQTASAFGFDLNSTAVGPHGGGFFVTSSGHDNSGFNVTVSGADNSGITLAVQDTGNSGVTLADQDGTGSGSGVLIVVQGTATSTLFISGLPTSSAGLGVNSVWNNGGALHIV